MGFVLKSLDKFFRIPSAIQERLQNQRKRENCIVGDDSWLHPESRISNLQLNRSAITIGSRSHILGQLLVFAHKGTLSIGDGCFVGEGSRIWSAHSIKIGSRVLVSHGVNIHDNNAHSTSAALRSRHFLQMVTIGHPSTLEDVEAAPVVIEDDVWIGFNSTILKGVTIGQGAIVGAGSLVTHPVPPYTIVAGNPARVVGTSRP